MVLSGDITTYGPVSAIYARHDEKGAKGGQGSSNITQSKFNITN